MALFCHSHRVISRHAVWSFSDAATLTDANFWHALEADGSASENVFALAVLDVAAPSNLQ
jgi:hypothetical protein